jgi:hypothetical protein
MNTLESKYAQLLDHRLHAGEIVKYSFESLKLKLAKRTFYTPDFEVVTPECIEIHEVKGFWEDDARVKIKVAAKLFPEFKFVAVQFKKKKWLYEIIDY